jgi:lipase
VRLHVHRYGAEERPPLVFLHGIGGQGLRARQLAESPLGDRFRVLGLDLRGHGRSSWDPPWGLDDHLADVRETQAAEGLEGATLVGHSFGGRLIAELGDGYADRVALLDPALFSAPVVALAEAMGACVIGSWDTVEDAVGEAFAGGWLFGAPRELILDVYAAELERGHDGKLRGRFAQPVVVAGLGECTRPWSADPPRVPTLVILGEHSHLRLDTPLQRYRELLGDRLEVHTIPRAGHSMLWDAAPETLALLDAFL